MGDTEADAPTYFLDARRRAVSIAPSMAGVDYFLSLCCLPAYAGPDTPSLMVPWGLPARTLHQWAYAMAHPTEASRSAEGYAAFVATLPSGGGVFRIFNAGAAGDDGFFLPPVGARSDAGRKRGDDGVHGGGDRLADSWLTRGDWWLEALSMAVACGFRPPTGCPWTLGKVEAVARRVARRRAATVSRPVVRAVLATMGGRGAVEHADAFFDGVFHDA